MASKRLPVNETAARAGVSVSVVRGLRRGYPDKAARDKGQVGMHPSIDVLVGLARALNVKLSWMLTWAGIGDEGDRWTDAEKRVLAELLGGEPADVDALLRARVKSSSASKES
jgi:hypothetical protein